MSAGCERSSSGAVQVDQVGREHVHAEQLLERFGFVAGRLGDPVRGVVDDRSQAVGMLPEGPDEGEDAGLAGEVGVQGQRAGLAQFVQCRALAAS